MADTKQNPEMEIDPENNLKKIEVSRFSTPGKDYIDIKGLLKKDLYHMQQDVREGKRTKEEYFTYLNKAKIIFERQQTEVSLLKKEYTKQRETALSLSERASIKLHSTVDYAALKGKNIKQDIFATLERKMATKDMIHGYNKKEGNFNEYIDKFEYMLKNDSLSDINGLLLKNYLIFLEEKGKLTGNWPNDKKVLENALGGGQKGKDRLLELSVMWSTKMEKEAHLRGKGMITGGKDKLLTLAKSKIFKFSEKNIENNIFKETFISELKESVAKEDKSKRVPGDVRMSRKEILIIKYTKLSYEDMIKDFKREIKDKDITGADVLAFFNKKEGEIDIEIKKNDEKKRTIGISKSDFKDKHCGHILNEHGVDQKLIPKDLAGLSFDKMLNSDQHLDKMIDIYSRKVDNEPLNEQAKNFLAHLQLEKQGNVLRHNKEAVNVIKKSAVARDTLVAGVNNNAPVEILGKSLELVKLGADSEKATKEALARIGMNEKKIQELLNNEYLLNTTLESLEKKNNPTKEDIEIIARLKKHKDIKMAQADTYTMVANKLTEADFNKMVASGELKRGFYDSESAKVVVAKNSKTPKNEKVYSEENVMSMMSRGETVNFDAFFGNNKKTVIEYKGISIEKLEKGKFKISNLVCSNKELPNVLSKVEFFNKSGLGNFAKDIDKTMTVLQESGFNKREGNMKFDAKQKFGDNEQNLLLKAFGNVLLGKDKYMLPEKISSTLASIMSKGEMVKLLDEKSLLKKGTQNIDYTELSKSLA